MLTANVSADKLARVWNEQYAQAWSLARPSVWVSSLAFAFASYQRYNNTLIPRHNVFTRYTGFSEVSQLALASGLIIAIVPITTFFMDPTYNKRLELAATSMEASRSKETSTVKLAILDEDAVREDVKGWAYVNSVRVAVLGAGFVVGLLAL